MKGGELSLSAEANEYNLDVYSHPGALPILPWDDDLMIRLRSLRRGERETANWPRYA